MVDQIEKTNARPRNRYDMNRNSKDELLVTYSLYAEVSWDKKYSGVRLRKYNTTDPNNT